MKQNSGVYNSLLSRISPGAYYDKCQVIFVPDSLLFQDIYLVHMLLVYQGKDLHSSERHRCIIAALRSHTAWRWQQ